MAAQIVCIGEKKIHTRDHLTYATICCSRDRKEVFILLNDVTSMKEPRTPKGTGEATKRFGDTIRKIREMKNLSQEDLAEILQCDRKTVIRYESGETNPRFNELRKMIKTLDIDPRDLF